MRKAGPEKPTENTCHRQRRKKRRGEGGNEDESPWLTDLLSHIPCPVAWFLAVTLGQVAPYYLFQSCSFPWLLLPLYMA